MTDINIDPELAEPGLPRPVQVGAAHYVDGDGFPRSVPIWTPSAATNNQRIQAEDIEEGWTLVREELFADAPPAPASNSAAEHIAAAAELLRQDVQGTTVAALRSNVDAVLTAVGDQLAAAAEALGS